MEEGERNLQYLSAVRSLASPTHVVEKKHAIRHTLRQHTHRDTIDRFGKYGIKVRSPVYKVVRHDHEYLFYLWSRAHKSLICEQNWPVKTVFFVAFIAAPDRLVLCTGFVVADTDEKKMSC